MLGAGPSGLTAAIRLQQMGRSVVILDRAPQRVSRFEVLTPGVADIVRYLGAAGVLARAQAHAIRRHRVAWTSRDVISRELSPGEAGWLVERHRFDRILAEAAMDIGVRIRASSRTIRIESEGDQRLVRYINEGRERVVAAKLVLEATGRPHGARRKPLGPSLMAISASFEGTAGEECEMLVEAVADGWAWMARGPDGIAHLTAFSDPAHVRTSWPGDPARALRALLGSTTHLSRLGEMRSFDGVCDASSYLCEDWIQDRHWKIGDAALGLDPLSSSGVEKSMRFALQAALSANTVLKSDGDPKAAKEFLSAKLEETCAKHRAWSEEFYASCCDWPTQPFWKKRGLKPLAFDEHGIIPYEDKHMESSQMLLGTPRVAADVVFTNSACALEDHIEYRRAVFRPGFAQPVVFVDGVELASLLSAVQGSRSYPELIDRWARVLPRDRAVRICAWAMGNGIVTTQLDTIGDLDGQGTSGLAEASNA